MNNDIYLDSDWASKVSNDVSVYSIRLTSSSPEPLLHMAGTLCGKVKKMGSAYLAGQGSFPLDEWKALLDNELTQSLNVHPDDANYAVEEFYAVISASDLAYPLAIHRFVEWEKESVEGEHESVWEALVRQTFLERANGSPSGNSALSLRDIPFHRAARLMPPSYQIYVQRVLRNCHSRRFFITDTGFMGLCPEETQIGDDVYASVGARIPLVLRKIDNGSNQQETIQFRLVGECFLEGRMWVELRNEPQYLDII